jgi:CubicO group peptidase (beta-lactamase class C family)
MRHQLIAGLLLGAAVPAHAQPAATAPKIETIDAVIPKVDAHFRHFMTENHVPGLVYGIVRDGRLVHVGTFGVLDVESNRPVAADSLFRIASMSKAFTALAILKLRDDGRLLLDAPAETYVPELRGWKYPTTDSPRIRVRDLLSHVAGFVTDDPWGDRQTPLSEEEFSRMLRSGVPFTRPPQTQYEYSNLGYALLGRIITNASGRPYKDYIEQEIMRPLAMTSTGYDIFAAPRERRALGYRWENGLWSREPDMRHGAFGAMGGVQTSVTDYARWAAFLLSAWPSRDGPEQGPAARASVRELAQGLNFLTTRTRPALNKGEEPCRAALAYGKGFLVSADCDLGPVIFHGGGFPGYGSFLLLMPDRGAAVFAFTNRTYSGVSSAVWNAALELHSAGVLPDRTLPVSDALARAYAVAGAMYATGGVAPARGMLAMNFLMDRSAENWAAELARLRATAGRCRTNAPLTATGALAGRFNWDCEKARIEGQLLLAPTNPPTIQSLRLSIATPK